MATYNAVPNNQIHEDNFGTPITNFSVNFDSVNQEFDSNSAAVRVYTQVGNNIANLIECNKILEDLNRVIETDPSNPNFDFNKILRDIYNLKPSIYDDIIDFIRQFLMQVCTNYNLKAIEVIDESMNGKDILSDELVKADDDNSEDADDEEEDDPNIFKEEDNRIPHLSDEDIAAGLDKVHDNKKIFDDPTNETVAKFGLGG